MKIVLLPILIWLIYATYKVIRYGHYQFSKFGFVFELGKPKKYIDSLDTVDIIHALAEGKKLYLYEWKYGEWVRLTERGFIDEKGDYITDKDGRDDEVASWLINNENGCFVWE